MGRLGDFLEAVYGPADRWRTVRAVVDGWADRHLGGRALSDKLRSGRKAADGPVDEARRICETEARVWLDGPARVRIEGARRFGGRTESRLTVVDGDRWWVRDPHGHVEAAGPDTDPRRRRIGPALSDVELFFSRDTLRKFFDDLSLEAIGPVETAGRECLRVRAVPRSADRYVSFRLPGGADEYEFHADPERGVLLFVAGAFRGEVFETHRVREVVYDEPMDAGRFTYELRPGEQVRPTRSSSG